jgi:hypothetical protein
MKYQYQLSDGISLVAECSEDLREQAQELLKKLAELNQKVPKLKDGTTIEFGWSLLTLSDSNGELVVCEPDFARDPFHNYVPYVDHTLRVLTEQVTLLNFLGLEAANSSFRDRILISRGCLQQERIYLKRSLAEALNDSGWYIGEVEDSKPEVTTDDLDIIYVYQLLILRPSLMKVLSLPPENLVVFSGDKIEAIFNESGKNIWIDAHEKHSNLKWI